MQSPLRLSRPVIALAVGLAALLVAGVVWAAAGFTLDRGRPVSGGASSGGGYTLIGAAGQPEAGQLSGGGYAVSGGVLAEQPTPTPTNTPPPGATVTFTPLASATPAPTNTPPPGASLTPTPTATPILADLHITISTLADAVEASTGAITTREGQTLELPVDPKAPLLGAQVADTRHTLSGGIAAGGAQRGAGLEPSAATNLQVTITNTGLVDTPSDFWVDLYINPGRTPAVNLTWDATCTDVCIGVSWHVTGHLHPGEALTLNTISGYDPDNTLWPGYVPLMARSAAVMVDSFTDQGFWYGMVLETNESNNLAQLSLTTAPTPAPSGPSTVFLPLVQRGGPP